MPGSVSVNSTSTTGPTTCTILPLFIGSSRFRVGSIVGELAAGNLQEFLGDRALTPSVVFDRQILDQVDGAVRGVLHRHHAGAVLAGLRLQHGPIHVNVEIVSEEITEYRLRAEFEEDLAGISGEVLFGLRTGYLQPCDLTDRKKLHDHGLLDQGVDESCRDHQDLIHVAFQEKIARETGNRTSLRKPR